MTFANLVTNTIEPIVNNAIIPLLYALAFIYLMYGVLRYFFIEGGSEEGRTKAKNTLMYGLLGMVVIFGIWGILNFLLSTVTSASGLS